MSFVCVYRSVFAPAGVTAALVAAACVSASPAFAAEVVWKGGGETAAWSDGSNWVGGTAPGLGDTAVIPAGKSAVWSQTDAARMNTFAGITLDGEMEVSGMTASTTLTVPLSGDGVFRGLDGGESASGISSGPFYKLALDNDNKAFTGTFAFTNCGVIVKHNSALGGAERRCTLIWKNATAGNHRRLYLQCPGPHQANMHLAQPAYSTGMIFATCDSATYLDGDIDFTGPVQLHANGRPCGFHVRGKLTNSGKSTYALNPHVYLEGEVNLQWKSSSQYGGNFYLGGGNGNVKNMGHLYVNSGGVHFAAPNVIGGDNPGGACQWILGNNRSLDLYLDGYDQNWYRKPIVHGFSVSSSRPATLRMMNYNSGALTFDTANMLRDYASFDVCATNAGKSAYTTTVKTTHCTTQGGLLCGAGTFVVGDSAASGVTTSFSNLTSLVTYGSGTMKIYNTDVNPQNGITNLSVLGTSQMNFASCVTQKTERAYLSSTAELTIAAGGRVKVSDRTFLDGEELLAGVYGKVGGTYEDGSPIPTRCQLSCITGDGYLETEGRRLGLIFTIR